MKGEFVTDLLVVGAGGAGLMAASTAALRNKKIKIVVLECNPNEKSNTEIASNFIPAAGTRYQIKAGIDDNYNELAADILRKNGGKGDIKVIHEICRNAPDALHQLADDIDIPLEYAPELNWLGHSTRRLHAHPDRSGPPIHKKLKEYAVRSNQIEIIEFARANNFIKNQNLIVGMTAVKNGKQLSVFAKKIALTTGGFSANKEMVSKYIPQMEHAPNIGSKTDYGDGILLAEAEGAQLSLMSGYQGRDCIFEDGTRITPPVLNEGGIAINVAGQRFVDETLDYSALAEVYRSQPTGFAYFIWDARIQKLVEDVYVMKDAMQKGGIMKAKSLDVLASEISIPAPTLKKTIDEYNLGIKNNFDNYGRKNLTQQLMPPWYSAKITGAIAHTQGGLRVDEHCRVLNCADAPIQNLYAGGNTIAGLSGDEPSGYLSGNGLLVAYATGLIIGNHVAHHLNS